MLLIQVRPAEYVAHVLDQGLLLLRPLIVFLLQSHQNIGNTARLHVLIGGIEQWNSFVRERKERVVIVVEGQVKRGGHLLQQAATYVHSYCRSALSDRKGSEEAEREIQYVDGPRFPDRSSDELPGSLEDVLARDVGTHDTFAVDDFELQIRIDCGEQRPSAT